MVVVVVTGFGCGDEQKEAFEGSRHTRGKKEFKQQNGGDSRIAPFFLNR